MKIYETIEIKQWADYQVCKYNFSTKEEEILNDTFITTVVNELNDNGYFVSATYVQRGSVVYVMTKIIE